MWQYDSIPHNNNFRKDEILPYTSQENCQD